MTNGMKLVFLLAAMVSTFFALMLSVPFVTESGARLLSMLGHALGLHAAPVPSALAVLGIPLLYLIFIKAKRSWFKKGGA